MSEQKKDQLTISVQDFGIIHATLIESYNSWLKKYKDGVNEYNYSQEQVQNLLSNMMSTFQKIDKILEPHKEMLMKAQQENLKNNIS